METEIKNAEITGTHLGTLSHGIFQFYIDLKYNDSCSQSYGGYALDAPNKTKGYRVGTEYGLEAIMQLLRVVGVDEWEDLIGKPVRVKASSYKITQIGNYLKDDWLDLEALSKEYFDKPDESNPMKPRRV